MATAWMTFRRGSVFWRGAVTDTMAAVRVRGPDPVGVRWRAYQPPTSSSTKMAMRAATENQATLDCPWGTTTNAGSNAPEPRRMYPTTWTWGEGVAERPA